jgi:hypothetical protein
LRVLLDECVPRSFGRFIAGHEVVTVPDAGWAGVKNGDLLAYAASDFDVFLTVDRNLAFQQDLSSLPLPVIVLESASTRVSELASLAPKLLHLLKTVSLERVVYSISE